MSNIVKQTASTTFWASVERIGLLGIQFVIGMVLALMLAHIRNMSAIKSW